jgi:hypothetical protein
MYFIQILLSGPSVAPSSQGRSRRAFLDIHPVEPRILAPSTTEAHLAKPIASSIASLDGYLADTNGRFGRAEADEETTSVVSGLKHLAGRSGIAIAGLR